MAEIENKAREKKTQIDTMEKESGKEGKSNQRTSRTI